MNSLYSILHANRVLIFWLAIISALSVQAGGLLFAVVTTLPTLLYQAAQWLRSRFDPQQRQRRLAACVMTAVVGLSIWSIHQVRADRHRAAAEAIAQQIDTYRQTQARYPTTLADIGVDAKAMRDEMRLYYSVSDDGEPWLSYASTLLPFDRWQYDFATRQWRYVPD